MKVIGVLGSPRKKGITATIAGEYLETARKLGADVKTYHLNTMSYIGCQSCEACKIKLNRCTQEDDLTPLMADIHQADILVLATPVYYSDVSGQFKCFFDRTYEFLRDDYSVRLAPGKRSVFVVSQGNQDEFAWAGVHDRFAYWLKIYGFKENHLLRYCGPSTDTDGKRLADTRAKAAELAKRMLAENE